LRKWLFVPFGIIDENEGKLYLTFGSSFETSDFIVDTLMSWWKSTGAEDRPAIAHVQIKVDNGTQKAVVSAHGSLNVLLTLRTIPEK
jgi:hypothetical protein